MVGILDTMPGSFGVLKLHLLDRHWLSLLGSKAVDNPD